MWIVRLAPTSAVLVRQRRTGRLRRMRHNRVWMVVCIHTWHSTTQSDGSADGAGADHAGDVLGGQLAQVEVLGAEVFGEVTGHAEAEARA